MKKKRNYRAEYDNYHKKPLSKGGSNKRKNLRVVSRSTNRKKGARSASKV